MTGETAKQSTPEANLHWRLMSANIAKSEVEHYAVKVIGKLEEQLAAVTDERDRERALNDKLVESYEKADFEIRKLKAELAKYKRMDSEAAQYVESVIAMRTNFTGEGKYVGWKGLGVALTESLDERDKLKAEREQMEKQEPVNYLSVTGRLANMPRGDGTRLIGFVIDSDKCEGFPLEDVGATLIALLGKLYAHPPVPDGKVLVPAEPTVRMLEAFWDTSLEICMLTTGEDYKARELLSDAYKDMLKAAQQGE